MFKRQFLDKLTSSEIALLKERGPKTKRPTSMNAAGVEFFEWIHDIAKNERGIRKLDHPWTDSEVRYSAIYVPTDSLDKVIKDIPFGIDWYIDYPYQLHELTLKHDPSTLLRWMKFDLYPYIYNSDQQDNRTLYKIAVRFCAVEILENINDSDIEYVLPISHKPNISISIGKMISLILKDEGVNVCFEHKYVKPVRKIREQSTLGPSGRKRNIENSLILSKKIYGKKILLIDDIITTGETIKEYLRIIKALDNKVNISVFSNTAHIVQHDKKEIGEHIIYLNSLRNTYIETPDGRSLTFNDFLYKSMIYED